MTSAVGKELIDRFRVAVAAQFGLALEDAHDESLASLIQVSSWASCGGDPEIFVARFECASLNEAELSDVINELSVGETYFFRHTDQFRVFEEIAIPARVAANAETKRLRVLSAACASGEEAYSIAILLREALPEQLGWDVEVIGFDLNPFLLDRAVRANYTSWSLRGISDRLRSQYFQESNKRFQLDKAKLPFVKFIRHNLVSSLDPPWSNSGFDVIFFRNVMMYLTPEAARRVISRLSRWLAPEGFLFLGPVETLRGIGADFHLRQTHDTFYYQRRSDLERSPAELPDPIAQFPLPPLHEDTSWMLRIDRSSERVAELHQQVATRQLESASGLPPRNRVDLTVAQDLFREERFDDLLTLLCDLADRPSGNPDLRLFHAAVLVNRGRIEESEQICHAVLAGDELNPEAHYLLALCKEHSADPSAAIEHDHAAVYLDGTFAMPHLHLGLVLKRQGDLRVAGRAFRRACDLLPMESSSRILLFGGGFSRESLLALCASELRSVSR